MEKLSLKRNLNPTLENNDYRTVLINHNVIKQSTP